MTLDLLLTVVGTLALFALVVAGALGAAGFHVRVAETDTAVERLRAGEFPVVDDESGDDVVAMLAAWREEATR